ncbi:hypothetical protein AAMO2058_001467600 [Amorphochlora amoebiformis]
MEPLGVPVGESHPPRLRILIRRILHTTQKIVRDNEESKNDLIMQAVFALKKFATALIKGMKEIERLPKGDDFFIVVRKNINNLSDHLQKLRRTTSMFRWLRISLRNKLKRDIKRIKTTTKDINDAAKSKKFVGFLTKLQDGSSRALWSKTVKGSVGSEVKTTELVNALSQHQKKKLSESSKKVLQNFFDPTNSGLTSIDTFSDALTTIEDENPSLNLNEKVTLLIKRIEKRVGKTQVSVPVAKTVEGNGFNEMDEKKGVKNIFEMKENVFKFEFTEKAKGYGDKEVVEQKAETSVRFNTSKPPDSRTVEAKFSNTPVTRWGINFSGVVKVRIGSKEDELEKDLEILIPGLKTYDPAGRTGDSHASEAVGASCTRFQGAISTAQIFAAVNGGGSAAIQKIQEEARPLLERFHGRSALFEWMQHQVQSVFVDYEEPLEYPAYIQSYFIETGRLDLSDPRHRHTARYMESFMQGLAYPPPEYFEKLLKKKSSCGVSETPHDAPPPKLWKNDGSFQLIDEEELTMGLYYQTGEANTQPERLYSVESKASSKEQDIYKVYDTMETLENIAVVKAKSIQEGDHERKKSTIGLLRAVSHDYKLKENTLQTLEEVDIDKIIQDFDHFDFNSLDIPEDQVLKLQQACKMLIKEAKDNFTPKTDRNSSNDLFATKLKELTDHQNEAPSMQSPVDDKKQLDLITNKGRFQALKELGYVVSQESVNFESRKLLGRGNFGTAWRCDKTDGTIIVIKEPHHRGITSADWKECRACFQLKRHPNVLNLLGVLYYNEKLCLASDFCERGSLDKLHHEIKIRHLHTSDPCVLHSDIRCANVLLDQRGNPVLCDWGLALCLDCPQSAYRMSTGTMLPWPWTAPEVLIDRTMTVKSDIYMFGVTVWEIMSNGKKPFDFDTLAWQVSVKQFAKQIREGKRTLSFPEVPPEEDSIDRKKLISLAKSCINPNPEKRPNAKKIAVTVGLMGNGDIAKAESI